MPRSHLPVCACVLRARVHISAALLTPTRTARRTRTQNQPASSGRSRGSAPWPHRQGRSPAHHRRRRCSCLLRLPLRIFSRAGFGSVILCWPLCCSCWRSPNGGFNSLRGNCATPSVPERPYPAATQQRVRQHGASSSNTQTKTLSTATAKKPRHDKCEKQRNVAITAPVSDA